MWSLNLGRFISFLPGVSAVGLNPIYKKTFTYHKLLRNVCRWVFSLPQTLPSVNLVEHPCWALY